MRQTNSRHRLQRRRRLARTLRRTIALLFLLVNPAIAIPAAASPDGPDEPIDPARAAQQLTRTWSRQVGTAGTESATAIGIDPTDVTLSVAGVTTGSLFGDHQGSNDGWFAHLAANDGTQSTARQFGDASNDLVGDLAVDPFGNTYVTGSTALTRFWMRHIAPDGSDLSDPYVDSADPSWGRAIAVVDDFNFVVGGTTNAGMDGAPLNNRHGWVRGYDNDYELQWTNQFKMLGLVANVDATGLEMDDMAVDSSGRTYAVGQTTFGSIGAGYQYQGYVMQIDETGAVLSDHVIEQPIYGPTNAIEVTRARAVGIFDDEVYVAGDTFVDTENPNERFSKGWVAMFDGSKAILGHEWLEVLNPHQPISESVTAMAVSQSSGDLYVASQADSIPTVTALDLDGQVLFSEAVGPAGMRINAMVIDENESLYLAGAVDSDLDGDGPDKHHGGFDAFVMRLDPPGPIVREVPVLEPVTPVVRQNGVERIPGGFFKADTDDVVELLRTSGSGDSLASLYVNCSDEELADMIRYVHFFYLAAEDTSDGPDELTYYMQLNQIDSICRGLVEEEIARDQQGPGRSMEEPPLAFTIRQGRAIHQLFNVQSEFYVDVLQARLAPAATATFAAGYDPQEEVAYIAAYNGDIDVYPTNPDLNPFTLIEGHEITVSADEIGPVERLEALFLPHVQR